MSLSLSAPPQHFPDILSPGSKLATKGSRQPHPLPLGRASSHSRQEPGHTDPTGGTHCRKAHNLQQEVISNSGFCNLFNQDPRRAHETHSPSPSTLPTSPEYILVLFLHQSPTGPFHHDVCTSSPPLPPKHVLLAPVFLSHKLHLEAASSSFTPPVVLAMWVLVEHFYTNIRLSHPSRFWER